MSDIFLSYSRDDQATAQRFAESLQREGFTVWWDQTLRSGEAYDEVTEQALKSARAVVVLWSKHSVASRWVRAEATIADRAGTLMPVMIEPCERPVMFELRQSADLSGWQGDVNERRWQYLVDDLRVHTGKPAVAASAGISPGPSEPVIPRPRLSLQRAALAAIGVAVIALGLWALFRDSEKSEGVAQNASAEAGTRTATIAVLPFDDISAGKDQEYFADGMTEEILNSLASIRGMQVTARTSSFYFKGRNEDMKSIGEKLGVDYLLEGSVRKAGDQLKITAQLIKAQDQFHLWSQTYDGSLKDIFKVQEDIARAIADALQISLGVGELAQIPGMTRDPEAYQAYLEAIAIGNSSDPDKFIRYRERLEHAVKRDPKFLQAWMRLSGSFRVGSFAAPTNSAESREMIEKADAAAEAAARASPDPRIASLLRSSSSYQLGEWIEAEKQFPEREATARDLNVLSMTNPARTKLLYWMAEDKITQAVAGWERERALDPLGEQVAVNLQDAYANVGRFADSLAEKARARSLVFNEVVEVGSLHLAIAMKDRRATELAWERGHSFKLWPKWHRL